MTLSNSTIKTLEQKIYNIEEVRNKYEFDLMIEKKKLFFSLTHPLKPLDSIKIIESEELAFFAGITFDDIGEVRMILYKVKNNGEPSSKKHGKKFRYEEIEFNL